MLCERRLEKSQHRTGVFPPAERFCGSRENFLVTREKRHGNPARNPRVSEESRENLRLQLGKAFSGDGGYPQPLRAPVIGRLCFIPTGVNA